MPKKRRRPIKIKLWQQEIPSKRHSKRLKISFKRNASRKVLVYFDLLLNAKPDYRLKFPIRRNDLQSRTK